MMKKMIGIIGLALLLCGCGEGASTYDSEQGRFRSTSEMRQEQRERMQEIERRLDQQR